MSGRKKLCFFSGNECLRDEDLTSMKVNGEERDARSIDLISYLRLISLLGWGFMATVLLYWVERMVFR